MQRSVAAVSLALVRYQERFLFLPRLLLLTAVEAGACLRGSHLVDVVANACVGGLRAICPYWRTCAAAVFGP